VDDDVRIAVAVSAFVESAPVVVIDGDVMESWLELAFLEEFPDLAIVVMLFSVGRGDLFELH
jgi:hypothetical protein